MIEELNKKDIHQIMDIWLKENKRTHTYIPEEYWDNHFEDVKKEILKAKIYVYKEKEEMKNMNFYVQWNGKEFCQADIVEQIKKQWESMGHTPESLEKLNIYLKPEESRAYFVANDSVQGCVEL